MHFPLRALLCAIVFVGLSSTVRDAQAQFELPEWQPAAAINAGLPSSISVSEFSATNPTRRAWLIRADASDTTWQFRTVMSTAPGGAETVTSFAGRLDAHVAINGGYFGGGTSNSLVIDQGRAVADNIGAIVRSGVTYYPTRAAFGQHADDSFDAAWVYNVSGEQYAYPGPNPNAVGTPAPRPTADHPEGGAPWNVYNAIGGGPMLVRDGEIDLTWEEEVFFGGSGVDLTSRRARTVLGYDEAGDLLILIWSESGSTGITLHEAAQVMLDAGAVHAVNLDGGGSTNLTAAGTTLLETGRAVVSAVVLAPRSSDDEEPEAHVFDTGDACCYREIGAWFESSNTPFWGETRSRLVAVGGGEARAVFTLEDIEDGEYDVSAWWVASTNRATNTPYRIYSSGEETTVRVDQTPASTLNRWNSLGRHRLAAGDSIVVSNDATGNATPTYVNVDAVRLERVVGTSTVILPSTPVRSLVVYPNPASDRLTIRFERLAAPGSIRIVDLLGREVLAIAVSPGGQGADVRLESIAPGVYGIEMRADGRIERSTFVVAR